MMNMRIFIIKNGFIVFNVFSWFIHLSKHFCHSDRDTFKAWFLNALTASSGWFEAMSWWTMIRLLLFGFRISPKTLDKQIMVYHPEWTVLRFSIGTIATWPILPQKHAKCFEVLLPRTTFVEFVFEDTHGGLSFFWDSPHRSMIRHLWRSYKSLWNTAIVFFQHVLTLIDMNHFFSECQIIRPESRTKYFHGQVFMQYWMYAGRSSDMLILHYQFTHGFNVLWHNNHF